MNREEIENTKNGRLESFQGAKHLLVSFGGIQAGLGIPVFEFFNSIADISCDKIFLRDFEQAWYQIGVDNELNSFEKVANYLKETIRKNKYDKVCFMGNSMGGYAAILFGSYLSVDQVISFAPQTFIDKWKRRLYKDGRWSEQINRIHASPSKNKIFHDLKKHLKNHSSAKTKIHIYFSPTDKLDKKHASRLKHFSNITLHSVNKGGHAVVKTIRDSGELNTLLSSFFKPYS